MFLLFEIVNNEIVHLSIKRLIQEVQNLIDRFPRLEVVNKYSDFLSLDSIEGTLITVYY